MAKIAGHYSELWPAKAGPAEGSIKDFASNKPEPDAHRISQYLHKGEIICSIMGVDPDVFEPTNNIIGASVKSDGIWVWRTALTYYFSKYHIRLQPAFLQHIRNHNYQIPDTPTDDLTEQLIQIL